MKSKPPEKTERSDTRLRDSSTLLINLVSADGELRARLHLLERTARGMRFIFSDTPSADPSVALYLLHLKDLACLNRPAELHYKPTLIFGPGHGLFPAFQHGCSDYLKDPWDERELLARISRFLNFAVITYRWGSLTLRDLECRGPDGSSVLSPCQATVFRTLVRYRGYPVRRQILAHLLWGEERSGSRAIDMHVAGLRRRLSTTLPRDVRNIILTCKPGGYMLR